MTAKLVLLHGFTGAPASFDELVSGLLSESPRLRVLRPALLGHDAREPLVARERPVRFEQEVDRLARLVREARFSGAHLCGYSLGARVALGLIARHGHLFAGATLIGVHPGLRDAAQRAARVGADERWCQLLLNRGLGAFLAAWRELPLFATQSALSPALLARQERVRSGHGAAGLACALRVLGLGQMPCLRGALPSARLGVRLVTGARDEKFTNLARGLADGPGRVVLDVVPAAGHNVLLEAPQHVQGVLLRAVA